LQNAAPFSQQSLAANQTGQSAFGNPTEQGDDLAAACSADTPKPMRHAQNEIKAIIRCGAPASLMVGFPRLWPSKLIRISM
jgi:hypothetical protein